MYTKLYAQEAAGYKPMPKEGDLYKTVTLFGKTFPLYYGYYEEFERYSRYNEPMPIYPDFLRNPVYTDDGTPLVTKMQDICAYYQGEGQEDSCATCDYFRKIEDLFGICICPHRRQWEKTNEKQTQGGHEI